MCDFGKRISAVDAGKDAPLIGCQVDTLSLLARLLDELDHHIGAWDAIADAAPLVDARHPLHDQMLDRQRCRHDRRVRFWALPLLEAKLAVGPAEQPIDRFLDVLL